MQQKQAIVNRVFPRPAALPPLLARICLLLLAGCGCDPASSSGGDPTAGLGGSGGSDNEAAGAGGMDPALLSNDADNPRIQYFGRWDTTDPKHLVGNWGPIYIKAKFEGTSLTVQMEDEQVTVPDGMGTGNYYQYSIDDGPFELLPSTDATEYVLATDLADTEHTVTLVRLTESKFGKTTFSGFILAPDRYLLEPDPRPPHKLEILGDSISAGLANENTGWYTNATENGYQAFGPQLARLLDAEWHIEARGGGSFYNIYWLPMRGFFRKTFGPYDMVHDPPAGALDWDFDAWKPDVYILALGTNDFSEDYTPHIEETLYVAEYTEFLAFLREVYPDAEVFCLAPFKEGAPWDEARSYIPTAVASMSDPHMHAINPVGNGTTDRWLTYPDDYVTGDEYHPNIDGHTKIANRLAEIIRAQMGW